MNKTTVILLVVLGVGALVGIFLYFNKKNKELAEQNKAYQDYISRNTNTSNGDDPTGISADSINQTIGGLTSLLQDLNILKSATTSYDLSGFNNTTSGSTNLLTSTRNYYPVI